MKVLVTGVTGQLGFDVVKEFKSRGLSTIFAPTTDELDITNEANVKEYITKVEPNVVIHCAAYTSVDKAELDNEACYKVNSLGTKYIAEACKEIDAKLIYISTDYVFDGTKNGVYEINDKTNPISTYGLTKYQGELFVKEILTKYFIVRISWVFGINGNNFVKTMLRLANMGKTELNVVCDQVGSPTFTADLAKLLYEMSCSESYGTYHATNEGFCSWYDFAKMIFEKANLDVKINPVTTDEYLKMVTQQAKRPKNSKMSKERLSLAGFNRLPSFEDAVDRFLKEFEYNG